MIFPVPSQFGRKFNGQGQAQLRLGDGGWQANVRERVGSVRRLLTLVCATLVHTRLSPNSFLKSLSSCACARMPFFERPMQVHGRWAYPHGRRVAHTKGRMARNGRGAERRGRRWFCYRHACQAATAGGCGRGEQTRWGKVEETTGKGTGKRRRQL